MDESLLSRIRECAAARSSPLSFAPASPTDIEAEESALGFPIPPLLKAVYLRVGNGGFGPGRGGSIIGTKGGYTSDFGSLNETHDLLKRDQESEGKTWRPGLLPFCEWGCNIFSCVDCKAPEHPVYLFEDFEARPEDYTLEDFFKMWIGGVDILSQGLAGREAVEITNPFTGKKIQTTRRRRD